MFKKILIAALWLPLLALAQSYPSPTFQNFTVNGTATIPHAAITGGTIDGAQIGAVTPSTGSFTTGAFSGAVIGATSISSPSLQTNLQGWPTQSGSYWQSQFHADWNVVQTQIANNPTEWQIYTNAAQGIAQTQSGTNQLVRQSGTNFSSAWVGFPYLYCDGTQYKVASFVDASHITVQTPAGGAVTFGSTANCTYYFVATTTTSTVNVSGTAVTYVSGQPFVSIFDNGQVYINGTPYSATYNSPTSLTLGTSLGTLTGATLNQYANINNELATIRPQGLSGANEENVALTFRPDGAWLQTLYAGLGKYRPMFFSVGENPAGTISPLISMYPAATIGNPGILSLGGISSNQAMQVNQDSANVNYWNVQGSHAGNALIISAAGTDTNIPVQINPKGNGQVTIASTSSGLNLNDTSGAGFAQLNYLKNGSQYWAWANNTSSNILSLNRFNAGVFTDSPISVSPSNGLVTFADGISPSTTKGIVGTTAADNANAGSWGEYQSNSTTGTSVTSLTPFNATSISLTAGDWDVTGVIKWNPAGSTIISQTAAGISTTSATLGGLGTVASSPVVANSAGGSYVLAAPPVVRISLASTTTVYLVGSANFGTSTLTADGFIRARRVR